MFQGARHAARLPKSSFDALACPQVLMRPALGIIMALKLSLALHVGIVWGGVRGNLVATDDGLWLEPSQCDSLGSWLGANFESSSRFSVGSRQISMDTL